MALAKATISSTIKGKLDTALGAAEDDAQRVKWCDAIAEAILDVLTNQAQLSGFCNGVTSPAVVGSPCTITNQAVTGNII